MAINTFFQRLTDARFRASTFSELTNNPVWLRVRDLNNEKGVLMVKPKDGFGKANMVRLWVHESLRVFGDRLVDDPDREWFLQHLNGMVSNRVMSACALRISEWKVF